MSEKVWRGEASSPSELATEIELAPSETLRLFGVEPLEIVPLSMSVANRDLVVRALRGEADATMRALGASDAACYLWPEDTLEHRALRAAFIKGASLTTGKTTP